MPVKRKKATVKKAGKRPAKSPGKQTVKRPAKKPGKRKPAPRVPLEAHSHALYLYCIGKRDELAPILEGKMPGAIEPEAKLDLVVQGSLAAVTSAVPVSDYRGEALENHLSDLAWTASRALRHERVVDHFASRATVVPVRFGAIYLERSGVEQMLNDLRPGLLSLVKRLRGKQEWGVNVYCDRAMLAKRVLSSSPRMRELKREAAAATPGKSYLINKRLSSLRESELHAETVRVVAEIQKELESRSESSVRLRSANDPSRDQADLVSKLAFLVSRDRFPEFRSVAERTARKLSAAGFRLEITGPWPPYSFTGEPESSRK